jgi:hypothetical protein
LAFRKEKGVGAGYINLKKAVFVSFPDAAIRPHYCTGDGHAVGAYCLTEHRQ